MGMQGWLEASGAPRQFVASLVKPAFAAKPPPALQ
jgi:hypothetical protein